MEHHSKSQPGNEIDLRSLAKNISAWLRYLKSKWLVIGLAIAIGAGLGAAYAIIVPPVYTANTTFVLENNSKSKSGGYAGIAAQFGLSLGGSGGGLFLDDDNMMKFLTSRRMIAQTLRTQISGSQSHELLIDRYLQFSGLKNKWADNPRLSSVRFHPDESEASLLEDSIISFCYKIILQRNLAVTKPDKELSIIAITTQAQDELFAKTFNEELLKNVTSFYISYQTKTSIENVDILRHQVDSVRGLLNSAISSVAISTDANPNLNPAFQRVKVPSQKRMVDVEMNKSILEELVKNLEISEISLRKEMPFIQVIDEPVLPLDKSKTGLLKSTVLVGTLLGMLVVIWLSARLFLRKLLA